MVPGLDFTGGPGRLLLVAAVFGIINSTLRPLLTILTCPLIVVTLGLFLFFSARQDLAAASTPEWNEEPAGYQLSSDGLDLLDVDWANDEDDDGVLVEHQPRPAEQNRRAQEAVEEGLRGPFRAKRVKQKKR